MKLSKLILTSILTASVFSNCKNKGDDNVIEPKKDALSEMKSDSINKIKTFGNWSCPACGMG